MAHAGMQNRPEQVLRTAISCRFDYLISLKKAARFFKRSVRPFGFTVSHRLAARAVESRRLGSPKGHDHGILLTILSLNSSKPALHLGLRAEGVNSASGYAHAFVIGRAARREKNPGDSTRPYRPDGRVEGRLITPISAPFELFDLINS